MYELLPIHLTCISVFIVAKMVSVLDHILPRGLEEEKQKQWLYMFGVWGWIFLEVCVH